MKEHRDYNNTIEKVNTYGIQYEAMLRGEQIGGESPTRRRSSVTPTKRASITTRRSPGARKPSADIRGQSPKLSLTTQNAFGGYGSRRVSTQPIDLDGKSPILNV